jgi:hypothetical protein
MFLTWRLIATTPTKLSKCASCSSLHSEGINLEDIRAPECFYIEETLTQTLHIPVFHDDQHGTAIISGAAVINAPEIVDLDFCPTKSGPGSQPEQSSTRGYSKTGTGRLTSLQQRLVKTGGRLVKHARYYCLLLAEGHLNRRRFGAMLRRILMLPVPAG